MTETLTPQRDRDEESRGQATGLRGLPGGPLLVELAGRLDTKIVAAAIAVYLIGYAIPGSPFPDWLPPGVLLYGLSYGAITALLGMGLILIYRANRIINFAYGAMGGMAGAVTLGLYRGQGMNWFLAVVIGVAFGAAVGGAVEFGVIRRFANSSRLVLTVATIGLAQVLGGFALAITMLLGGDMLIASFDTPLSADFFLRPYLVRGDHLFILVVVPLVLGVLAWFMLRTDVGVAVRAAAENNDRARLLGIPVRRLSTIVWMTAGGLATLTYVLKAPIEGVTPSVLVGPQIILPALAVAVIARLESLPIALFAGLGLGLLEWITRWNTDRASPLDVAYLLIILGVLLLQRQRMGRAEEGESHLWSGAREIRRIPAELRRLPEVVWTRRVLIAALAVFALWLPHGFGLGASDINLITVSVLWAVVAVSLVVLAGWGGNISLGQWGIAGVGAVVTGNLLLRYNIDMFWALAAAGAAGAAIAVCIGLPALRVRGLFLAVTTIAFAVALDSYFLNPVELRDWIPSGISRPVLFQRWELAQEYVLYYVAVGFLALAAVACHRVRRSRGGRSVLAARDNDRAAGAMALPTAKTRLKAFVFSGVIAGVAGGLYVVTLRAVGQGTFTPIMSFEVFSMAVIGGLGSVGGAVLGVFSFRLLNQVVSETVRLILTGTGLLVVLYFLPGGMSEALGRLRDMALRAVAQRRGILVPSLVADRQAASEDRPEDETGILAGALATDEDAER